MKSSKPISSQHLLNALQKRQQTLKQRFKVRKIGLFGSYANRKQTAKSDIDLIVDFEEPTFDNFMGLITYLEELFGRKVDVLTPEGIESIRVKSVAEDIKKNIIYVG